MEEEEMRTTKKRAQGRLPRALTTTLVLALLAALLLAGTALAAATPGKPTAKAPKGTITQAKPTFKWSKAARATKYEVRVYKGSKLQLRKTGLAKLSWKSSKALPKNVSLTWKVRARNARGNGAWSKRLTFKVVTPPSSTKAITAFNFVSPAATGVTINESDHTIALIVPFGTDVSALVPTITITGASVSPASGVANNFTSPVTYRVTAANASTQDYTVTVTVAANPAKAITAFSFQGLSPAVTGFINEAAHTIALIVPFGTDVSALVPTITITGASVSPASGAANNFTSPITYTVTAADASTQAYPVTVTVAPLLTIGQSYFGGKVAYILQSGNPGYDANVQHGLIAAADDQSRGIRWYNGTNTTTGAGTALGTGSANTTAIITSQGGTPGAYTYAAGLARDYRGGGNVDWYLPSWDELNKLYLNRVAIGGFSSELSPSTSAYYWSSSEFFASSGWYQQFDNGSQNTNLKSLTYSVRAVRTF